MTGSTMESAAECYAMAEQCERQAQTVGSARAREILEEVAGKWRSLGDQLKAPETTAQPSAAAR
jgi:hypothetical protein